jgi:hypothetical protein
MKNLVTIMAAPKIIIVDGVKHNVLFIPPSTLRLTRWQGEQGEVTYNDGRPPRPLHGEEDYNQFVKQFVDAWESVHAMLLANGAVIPEPSAASTAARHRVEEILELLPLINLEEIRSAAELILSPDSAAARGKLQALEAQAQGLRDEMSQLKQQIAGDNNA